MVDAENVRLFADAEPFDISPELHVAWGWLAVAIFAGLFAWLCSKQARYLIFEEARPWWLASAVFTLVAIYGLVSFIGSLFVGVTFGALLAFGFFFWLFTSGH